MYQIKDAAKPKKIDFEADNAETIYDKYCHKKVDFLKEQLLIFIKTKQIYEISAILEDQVFNHIHPLIIIISIKVTNYVLKKTPYTVFLG